MKMRPVVCCCAVLALALVTGCGDDSPGVGSEGGPCYADGTCDGDLVCLSSVCVNASECSPGAAQPCQCAGGRTGVSTCDASGAWGPCDCGAVCGDGVVDVGEECDDGQGNSDTEPDACRTDCRLAYCGDGVLDTGEGCDDGNTQGGDGCAGDCVQEVCGDGIIEGDEVCDGVASAGLTCIDFGFDGGTLGCASDCGPILAGCHTCGNGTCEASENPTSCAIDCAPTEKVDVLFVIDNSSSMAPKQQAIASQITSFISALRSATHGLPDVHIGVTSTDLGSGQFAYTYCDDPPTGDEGHLLTSGCANPSGAPYVVDVAPTGCTIQRDGSGQCTSSDCTQSNCSEGTLQTDASGCPRCRNYSGEALEDVFACIASLGVMGCGFEQPMEAMRKALDSSNTFNSGFLRDDAILGVFFLTDEDDCSASTDQLFDNTQTEIDSPLGPPSSFRCFEFGVTCDVNARTAMGVRHNCRPRDDPGALLYPISDYVTFLSGLRDPGRIVLAAAAGPVEDHSATVGMNSFQQPELEYSCTTASDGAVPGIRLLALVEQFVDPMDIGWAFSPICSLDYSGALSSFALEIRSRM